VDDCGSGVAAQVLSRRQRSAGIRSDPGRRAGGALGGPDRALDRAVREQIATWDGGKGDLVAEVLGERDAIDSSDEGRSFRAFWELLVSQQRQEEMAEHLERVLVRPAVAELGPDRRMRRIHRDWLDAGEHTQRTVALLSSQLRRFLDDHVWLEDRRIVEILRRVEATALAVREQPPAGVVTTIDLPHADVGLPFERPLSTTSSRRNPCRAGVSRGADDGIRTRDPHLGKVMLYQLSHVRVDH
jgi:hypothetical protein